MLRGSLESEETYGPMLSAPVTKAMHGKWIRTGVAGSLEQKPGSKISIKLLLLSLHCSQKSKVHQVCSSILGCGAPAHYETLELGRDCTLV